VAPSAAKYPKIQGGSGISAIMDSWSGAVLDTRRDRLVVWGGGASNYYGNEVYAFDFAALSWQRLTEPTAEPTLNQDVGLDGRPTARSTYNGIAYVAHLDRMFAQGGSLAGGGGGADHTWMFDFVSGAWTDRRPPASPGGGFGCTATYDPATRRIWLGSGARSFAGLWSYDVDANVWTKHTGDDFADVTSTLDPKRGLLVFVGRNEVFTYDLRGGAPKKMPWTTTGGAAFIAKSGAGLDYDSARDRLVGWHGGAVFELDPESKVWTTINAPGAPEDNPQGIYGRWRYVPSLRAFVVVTKVDGNVHLYKP